MVVHSVSMRTILLYLLLIAAADIIIYRGLTWTIFWQENKSRRCWLLDEELLLMEKKVLL
jgi:hypothetical protein